ncbi:MAG: group I intron-associated PD-(D/E)XK endonuclease [Steroidobacteraceae bacterium]
MTTIDDRHVGLAGEHLVAADLLLRGVPAHLAAAGSPFDVIAEVGSRLVRVQVKTTRCIRSIHSQHVNPIYFFKINRCGKGAARRYDGDAFDAYAFVALDRREVAYLPHRDARKTTICIRDQRISYAGNNGGVRKGLVWQEMTWDRCVEAL